tara:strand:+ start:427 stop:1068 length:642 start_codon:yes stop_codon:yes gene_type:complete
MSEDNVITVELRDRVGKGAARAARREGLVPGIIYGDKRDPQPIVMERRQLERLMHSGAFFNSLYDLKAGDLTQRVLPRDVQTDVVTDVPLHVDFLRLAVDAEITIEIPVIFIGEEDCPGLRHGGVLNVVRHEIEVRCRADAIPEHFELDLSQADVGDSLHISAVTLPEGVVPTITDRDFTIATIAAPTVQQETTESEEEGEQTVAESGDGDED